MNQQNVATQEELMHRIYRIMEDGHMSQAAVARAAGFTPTLFNSMLKGRKLIRAEHIEPICQALRVTPNDLYGYKNCSKG